MTTLYVNYEEKYLGGGEQTYPYEEGLYVSHNDVLRSFGVISITLENTSPYHETIDYDLPNPPPNGLFVVVAHYYDGGTFGRTCGYGSIEGVFATHEEAAVRATKIDSGAPSIKGYTPWGGYFAGLERTEVVLVPIVRGASR